MSYGGELADGDSITANGDLFLSGANIDQGASVTAGGSINLGNSIVAGNYDAQAGTEFASNSQITGTIVSLGPNLTIDSSVVQAVISPASGPATFQLDSLSVGFNSVFSSTASFDVSGAFTWDGGGTMTVPAIDAQGSSNFVGNYTAVLEDTQLTLNGNTTLSGGGNYDLGNGASITNLGSITASDSLQSNNFIGGPGTTFTNLGSITLSGQNSSLGIATGTASNQGSVLVMPAAGSFGFGGAGISSGPFTDQSTAPMSYGGELADGDSITANGDLFLSGANIDQGASVTAGGSINLGNSIVAGNYDVQAGTEFASNSQITGTIVSLGPNLTIDSSVVQAVISPASGPATFQLDSLSVGFNSVFSSTASFDVSGAFTWDGGGTMTVPAIDAQGSSNFVGNYTAVLEDTQLTLNGNTTLSGGGNYDLGNGASITNLGSITASDSLQSNNFIGGPGTTFTNLGSITLSGQNSSLGIATGTASNQGSVLVEAGTLDFEGVNAGIVTVDGGSILDSSNYTQMAGSSVLDGGTLAGGPILINGGSLSGSGTVDGDVTNSGQVIPGGTGTIGQLKINGNYTQTPSGSLNVEIGSGGSDQLAVSGSATMGGQLDVSLINGFRPALADTFQDLTFASSSGTFAYYNGIVLGKRLILDPTLNPGNLTLTVQPAETTTILDAPPSPSVSGQSVTFSATVTVALPPTTIDPAPTGTVTFYDNGSSIGTGTLNVVNGQDQASLTIATLSTVSHPITAAYTSGDGNFIPSPISTALTQVVNPANTMTTIATSVSPSVHGQAVTFTAMVSVVSPGSTAVASPTGIVTFYDNGTSLGTGNLGVVNGQDVATYTTSVLATASHPITAAYTSRDGNFNASPVSAAFIQVVNKDSTTTVATASPNFANIGQTVTVTATVSVANPGGGTPTGVVTFKEGSTTLGTGTLSTANSVTIATFSTTALAVGARDHRGLRRRQQRLGQHLDSDHCRRRRGCDGHHAHRVRVSSRVRSVGDLDGHRDNRQPRGRHPNRHDRIQGRLDDPRYRIAQYGKRSHHRDLRNLGSGAWRAFRHRDLWWRHERPRERIRRTDVHGGAGRHVDGR